MERLCARRQTAQDDADGDRVLTTLLAARVAERLCQHPAFRFAVESIPRRPSRVIPAAVADQSRCAADASNLGPDYFELALPTLWRIDDPDPEANGCGAIVVQLLRFLIAPPPSVFHRRAHSTPSCWCAHSSPLTVALAHIRQFLRPDLQL